MGVYNENRDKNQSMHDEIREQNRKLKGAPLKEKFAYFWEYYSKATAAVIAVLIFIIALIHSIVSGPKDSAFTAYFFDDAGSYADSSLAESFAEYKGINTSEHTVSIDATLNSPATNDSYNSYLDIQKIMAVISTKELDVIIGSTDTIDYFVRSECIADMNEVFSTDLMQKYSDKLYFYTDSETNNTYPVGVYVKDAPKLANFYFMEDQEPVLSFILNSNNIDNALDFLDYIYME